MIEDLLKTIERSGSENNFTAAEVRDDVVEWLELVAEEHADFPETAGEPVWNLNAKDFDDGDDAFVAYVFEADTVTFAAGRTPGGGAIIRFCENEFDGEATEVIAALQARFKPVAVRSFPRADVERWLGR